MIPVYQARASSLKSGRTLYHQLPEITAANSEFRNFLCNIALPQNKPVHGNGRFLALPANASLQINASGGSATLDSGGVYEHLKITGSANPELDITRHFTIIGPGDGKPIITSAASAHLRLIDTALSLGSSTRRQAHRIILLT